MRKEGKERKEGREIEREREEERKILVHGKEITMKKDYFNRLTTRTSHFMTSVVIVPVLEQKAGRTHPRTALYVHSK